MNWVGGARSRLQRRSNKKVQQEFFEKKRQEKKIASIRLNSPKKVKLGLSQDLLSLHTISRAHDAQTKLRKQPHQKIRHVVLDERTPLIAICHNTSTLTQSPDGKPSQLDFHSAKDRHRSQEINIKKFGRVESGNQRRGSFMDQRKLENPVAFSTPAVHLVKGSLNERYMKIADSHNTKEKKGTRSKTDEVLHNGKLKQETKPKRQSSYLNLYKKKNDHKSTDIKTDNLFPDYASSSLFEKDNSKESIAPAAPINSLILQTPVIKNKPMMPPDDLSSHNMESKETSNSLLRGSNRKFESSGTGSNPLKASREKVSAKESHRNMASVASKTRNMISAKIFGIMADTIELDDEELNVYRKPGPHSTLQFHQHKLHYEGRGLETNSISSLKPEMGNAVNGKKKDELEDPEEILRKAQKKVDELLDIDGAVDDMDNGCWRSTNRSDYFNMPNYLSLLKDSADFMETPLIRTAYEECRGTIEEEDRTRDMREREHDDRAPVDDSLHSSASLSGISAAIAVDTELKSPVSKNLVSESPVNASFQKKQHSTKSEQAVLIHTTDDKTKIVEEICGHMPENCATQFSKQDTLMEPKRTFDETLSSKETVEHVHGPGISNLKVEGNSLLENESNSSIIQLAESLMDNLKRMTYGVYEQNLALKSLLYSTHVKEE